MRAGSVNGAFAPIAVMMLVVSGAADADVITLVSPNEEEHGFFGGSVSAIPDVDGDGIADVIVGASWEDGGGFAESGRAYVFSGATGALIRAHNSPNGEVSGGFGAAVAGVKDLNNDGAGDYVVGAPGELFASGRVYVFSGDDGALIRTHTSFHPQGFGLFGRAVAGLDDMTGDGRGDILIGAPGEDSQRGHAYVYNGGTGQHWRTHLSPNQEDFGSFGAAVAGLPDTNNDGRGDYVVGAPNESPGGAPEGAGRAYHFDGLSGSLTHTLSAPFQQEFAAFGSSVGGVPDVGGNGSGDIIVGAPGEDIEVDGETVVDAGRAHLFSGTTGFVGHSYRESDVDAGPGHQFGSAVDGVLDRDGDGLGEVVIGAQGIGAYDVYVFRGTGAFEQLEVVHTPDPLGTNQFYGSAVAGHCDTNGDGKGDFIVGGRGCDNVPNGSSQSGRAWIHRANLLNNGCGLITVGTLVDGPNEITNAGATGTGSGSTQCLQKLEADVWFRYTATCDGAVTFSTCDANLFDTIIAVYPGCSYGGFPAFTCQLSANPLVCNDDTPGCSLGSVAEVACAAGQCFFVRVGGYEGDQGLATLTVTCAAGCLGDLDGSGSVDGGDITILLGNWGTNGAGDLSGNGTVGGEDITILLGAWGPC